MDDTRELVTAAQAGTAFAALSVIALVGAAVCGGLARKSPALVRAALLLGAAAFTWPLWLVYNGIENHFGLDSVAALLLNLALFAVIGTAGGLVIKRFWPSGQDQLINRQDAKSAENTGETEGAAG